MTRGEYWYWLCNIEHVGIKKIQSILKVYKNPEEAYHESVDELRGLSNISDSDIMAIKMSKDSTKIQENYAKLKEKGIYFVSIEDEEYPEKLRHIYNPPHCLYYKGNLPDDSVGTIAIIGARNCSDYGREMAKYFSKELSKAGLQIISGLARGIDGYAHEGALNTGGKTFGVEGCGVDICYPKENFMLYMQMQSNGGILSEYGLGTSPKAGNFPMRNRLISGLSDGILVIEAKEKSGSFITVEMGLEQGKNIYSLPGRVNDALSLGCNNLIKMGAKLVSNPGDILEDFNLNYEISVREMKKNDKLLETNEKMVYASLSLLPKHINEIAGETSLSIVEITEMLINLELKEYIKEVRRNYYVIN